MASFKTPIALLFLTLISLSHPISGDSTLVQIVCRETDNPEVCDQCLSSAHGPEVETKLGIATFVITCLEEHGTSLGTKMSSIALRAKEDYEKRILEGCSKDYSDSNKDLISAAALLKGHRYDAAERAVTVAFYRHELCGHNVDGGGGAHKKVTLPDDVSYEMTIYEDLCQVADRIIERLSN